MKKKYKLGQKVIFVRSRIPFYEDQGVMDKYIGTIGVVTELDVDDTLYDYIVDFGSNARYSVREDEIIKITKATKVLYGL